MKAILEFNLPEDSEEHQVAVKARDLYLALWDIDQWLRGKVKYSEGKEFEDPEDALDKTREQLREIMSGYGLNFEMMS
jgi:hypothetical protein